MELYRSMLHYHSIWKHMRKITKKEIEKRATIELVIYLENQIEKITRQSEIELEKQNKLRKKQGIHQKARIDPNSLKKAINFINLKGHCQSPKKAGGIKKEGEKYVKHTPEKSKDQEVEIL